MLSSAPDPLGLALPSSEQAAQAGRPRATGSPPHQIVAGCKDLRVLWYQAFPYWRRWSGGTADFGRRTGVAAPRILEATDCGVGAAAGESDALPVVTGITASDVYESGPEMSRA